MLRGVVQVARRWAPKAGPAAGWRVRGLAGGAFPGCAVPAFRRSLAIESTAGEAVAQGLRAGSLVVVALRDSAKSPRRLAVVKGPAAGPGGYILLEMDAQQEVAVRPQSIKMALPAPGDAGEAGLARCASEPLAHARTLCAVCRVDLAAASGAP